MAWGAARSLLLALCLRSWWLLERRPQPAHPLPPVPALPKPITEAEVTCSSRVVCNEADPVVVEVCTSHPWWWALGGLLVGIQWWRLTQFCWLGIR
eukprot:6168681-Lingulodinium_polyedra.AAC.1